MSVILICGLNGSGKTTLGRELAGVLGFEFLNDEDYYFLESEIPFSKIRTDEEARKYIISYIEKHENVVIVSTRGNLGNTITLLYDCVIYLSAPVELRLSRIKNRELERFGARVLRGGDMYEQQEKFRDFAASRTPEKIETWLDTLSCPVIKLDGTASVSINVEFIKSAIENYYEFST